MENPRFNGTTNNGEYSLELDSPRKVIHLQIRNDKDPELLSGTVNEWLKFTSQLIEFILRMNDD